MCKIEICNFNGKREKILQDDSNFVIEDVYTLVALPYNRLASGSGNKTILIWDIESGAVIHKLEGHTDHVRSLILMNDVLTLASASKDETIKLWDIESGKLINTIRGHTDNVTSVALLEDGRLVSGSEDKSIIIWK